MRHVGRETVAVRDGSPEYVHKLKLYHQLLNGPTKHKQEEHAAWPVFPAAPPSPDHNMSLPFPLTKANVKMAASSKATTVAAGKYEKGMARVGIPATAWRWRYEWTCVLVSGRREQPDDGVGAEVQVTAPPHSVSARASHSALPST